jgi:IS5 family transposase
MTARHSTLFTLRSGQLAHSLYTTQRDAATKKGNQWYFGMKVHIGVDKDSGLIHSVETTSANVHDITRAAQLLHGDEQVVYGDADYQGIEKRAEIADKSITYRVAMRLGKQRVLPKTPDGRLSDLVETAKAHIRDKVEHPFRVIKQQFGFQKTRLRGVAKNHCKVNVMAALTNLYLARDHLHRQDKRTNGVSTGHELDPKNKHKVPLN